MKPRSFDPLCLDVEAFAEQGASLSGTWPPQAMPRLTAGGHAQGPGAGAVAWSVRGERRPERGAVPQTWLHLVLSVRLHLECQRCLQPVDTVIEVDRLLRFVTDEAAAAALDADCEDDVLVSSHTLDLRELAEDELLLAFPLVPRHASCPQPLAAADAPAENGPAKPFALLAQLKSPGPGH